MNVSFIIPAYNVELYISQCLDSVLLQTIDNKEIIIINDGSTDKTLDICNDYKLKNPEIIKIFTKDNQGLSIARNFGLKLAKGEYVIFIDSDDYYLYNFISSFYILAKHNNLDVIRGNYNCYLDGYLKYSNIKRKTFNYYNKVLSGMEYLEESINSNSYEVVVVLSLFRREFLISNNLIFEFAKTYEDHEYTLKYLLIENIRIMHVLDVFYAYRMREGSITKTPQIRDAYSILDNCNNMLCIINNLDIIKQKYPLKAVSMLFYQLTSLWGKLTITEKQEVIKVIPYELKLKVLRFPFNKYQFMKIALFIFTPSFVNFVYKNRLKWNI